MTIYPEVDTAILDIIFQFYCEGSVSLTIGKLGTLHLERRYMMSDNYLFPGVAVRNGFFQKRKAPCVFKVEVCKREKLSIEEDASEVAYDLFRIVCLLQGNLRPQSCYDKVDVFYVYNSIIITVNVGTYFKTKAIVKLGNVIVFVELVVAHANYHLLIVL